MKVPEKFAENTQCHGFNGELKSWGEDQYYNMMKHGVILLLYKFDEGLLTNSASHAFKSRSKILLNISEDGSAIVFLNKTEQQIQIYDLDSNPANLFTKLEF
jgi:two-component sensor histidine kinase